MDIEFLKILKDIQKEDLFNPYTDVCPYHDNNESPLIRVNNLIQYLNTVENTDSLLIGEAPGYKGCRRTGIAFTDEYNLTLVNNLFDLQLKKATATEKTKEISATTIWNALSRLNNPPFLWNIIPFHPYNPPKLLSNRTPNGSDYKTVQRALLYFLDNTSFDRIFAVGRIAQKYLQLLGHDCIYIRHPSHGGINKFTTSLFQYFKRKPGKLQNLLILR